MFQLRIRRITAKATGGVIIEDKVVKKVFEREILQHNENIFESFASSNVLCFVIRNYRRDTCVKMRLHNAQEMEYSLLQYAMYV